MRRPIHGFTLLEVMVAMGILLVGLLGLMRLQILGLSWNQSARAQSRATELALELRAGIEQLPWGDDRLKVTDGWGGNPPPDTFGALLGTSMAGARAWDDANPIPGVTLDRELGPDPTNPAQWAFQRRWRVYGFTDMTSMNAGALIIAISVIYVDRGSLQPREVVVYTQRANPAAVLSSLRISS